MGTKKISDEQKSEMIRKIQLVNLNSLKKLDEISKKYGIKYWAAYGTLLGAVRHQGFIPWDDDLDVAMLREDYEKLQQVPVEEWGDDCLFLTGRSDDLRHDKIFGRIYQKKSRIQSYKDVKNWKNPGDGKAWSTSMMCDVYVFDRITDDEQEWRRIYNKARKITNIRYKLSKLDYQDKGKLKAVYLDFYGKLERFLYKKPWKRYVDILDKRIASSKEGKRVGIYYTEDPYKYNYEDMFPLQVLQFEDMEIPVPKNYEQILTDMYGDYMQYPPESERYHINFIYADLGNGETFVIDPIPDSLGAEGKK